MTDVQTPTPAPATPARQTKIRRLEKKLNINTPKFHAMGDYVPGIRRVGTIDGYTTERVSSACP